MKVWITDVTIARDSRIEDEELEKNTRYRDLQMEVERLLYKPAIGGPSDYWHTRCHTKKTINLSDLKGTGSCTFL